MLSQLALNLRRQQAAGGVENGSFVLEDNCNVRINSSRSCLNYSDQIPGNVRAGYPGQDALTRTL